MNVDQQSRREWEARLPDLGPHWTHWRLVGDGAVFAVVPGHRLGNAVRIVAENHQRFSRIQAFRARADEGGECIAFENFSFDIVDRSKAILPIDQRTTDT